MSPHQSPLPDWIYRQSAALPYRWRGDELEVLLITSRKGKRWMVPKGIVEPGLSPPSSAAKEALEEAGVRGDISDEPVGSYQRQKWGGMCTVAVYPLAVSAELIDWPESSFRRRRWMSVPNALNVVDEQGLKDVVARFPNVAPAPGRSAGRLQMPEPPARLLYLLRHAEANRTAESGQDIDRPLTHQGFVAGQRMHRYLSMADVLPDLILCSTALRARQTLDSVMPVVGAAASVRYLDDIYEGDAGTVWQRLRTTDNEVNRLMVVGHNPTLLSLVRLLGGRSSTNSVDRFPAGALAILEFPGSSWSELGDSSCELHSLVASTELAAET